MQSTEIHARNKRIIFWGRIGLIVLYLVSLLLPSVRTLGDGWFRGWFPGFLCLILVPIVMAFPPWWANLFFFVGLVLLFNQKLLFAFRCGVVATVLSLSMLAMCQFAPFKPGQEGISVGPGYFTWLGCMIGLTWLAWNAHLDSLEFPQRNSED